jgi:preprotein translocase subunit SecE
VTDSKGSTGALSGSTPDPGRSPATSKSKTAVKERRNPIARFGRFVREIVAELRKVIYPTRNELVTYTIVVVVFVSIITSIVFGLDWVFAKVVLYIFGKPNAGD